MRQARQVPRKPIKHARRSLSLLSRPRLPSQSQLLPAQKTTRPSLQLPRLRDSPTRRCPNKIWPWRKRQQLKKKQLLQRCFPVPVPHPHRQPTLLRAR